jgi:tetratricopeptide (TPR) repeat protein
MISLQELKKWLNHFDTTQLGHKSIEYLDEAADDATTCEARRVILGKLLENAKNSLNPYEFAEASFLAGELLCEKDNDFRQAQPYFEQAAQGFLTDQHRHAVALWALGFVERKNLSFNSGYRDWTDARDMFEKIAQTHEQAGLAERLQLAPWYRARLEEMDLDIALTVEEAYSMLDVFEPSPLDEISRELIRGAVTLINKQRRASAFAVLSMVRERGKLAGNYLETPAGLVECGLACYQMGFRDEADALLREAVEKYHPFSHRQAVAGWMLGCLWVGSDPELARREKSLADLRSSLLTFETLGRRAVQQNQKKKACWYQARIPLLKNVFQQLNKKWLGA